MVRAYPIPTEETATTVPRFTRPQRRITPVAGLTTLMGVTTRPRAGITHRLHGITSHRRVTTTSRGFINRPRAITSRRHELTTASTRTVDGTVMTAVVGTVVTGAIGMAGTEAAGAMAIEATGITVMEEAITAVGAITMAETATVNHSIKNGA